jgi:alkyldihydroxyacetonephosphate synthase
VPHGTRNPIGWGFVEEAATDKERRRLARALQAFLGIELSDERRPPPPEAVALPAPRIAAPPHLSGLVHAGHTDRLLRATGRSYANLAHIRSGRLEHAPDLVATPTSEDELERVLEWAHKSGVAAIPFGGGSSVVGGVDPLVPDGFAGVMTLDLQGICEVHEVSTVDRTVTAGAGILGPDLDRALAPHGLTMRHYPQSYLHSTLGGWVATRSAGHYATHLVKIEDRVEAMRVLLPDGRRIDTLRVPASSVGPDPNRLWAGSEGALGIITQVTARAVPTPKHRQVSSVHFARFDRGLEAMRDIVQAGLQPSHLRLLDPYEQAVSAAMSGGRVHAGSTLILGFEAAELDVAPAMAAALRIASAHGGSTEAAAPESSAASWRSTFFRTPYLRDAMLDWAVVAETFETAVPWSRAAGAYASIRDATLEAVLAVCGTGGVLARTTHAYPDGISLYFTYYGRGRHGALAEQAGEIKAAASAAVVAAGGTISHHHAMGRDHKRWAAKDVPAPYQEAIRAAKRSLDPSGILNPGLWWCPG